MKLNNLELSKVSGGGALTGIGIAALVSIALAFIIGIVDGIVNPQDCN